MQVRIVVGEIPRIKNGIQLPYETKKIYEDLGCIVSNLELLKENLDMNEVKNSILNTASYISVVEIQNLYLKNGES